MNNPFDPSLSSNNSDAGIKSTIPRPESFSIRTMHDDLAELGKNPQAKKLAETTPEIPKPVQMVKDMPVAPFSEMPGAAPTNNDQPDLAKAFFEQSKASSGNVQPPISPQSSPSSYDSNAQTSPFQTSAPTAVVEMPLITEKRPSILKKIVLIFVILLAVAGIAFGGYYFWKVGQKDQAAMTQPQPEPIQEPVILAPTEKYSQEKPNYLTLDIATLNSQAIKASLESVAAELQVKPSGSLYEFIVVDANNNPVAFPIFATAAKWNLSPTLLENLGETFSLYFYNDVGNVRLATAAMITSGGIVKEELLKQETAFITDASFLFLGSVPATPAMGFKDSTYNNTPIRYLNFDELSLLSVDYALTDSWMIVGTSKNTTRTILDRMLATETPGATIPVSSAENTLPANDVVPVSATPSSSLSEQIPAAPLSDVSAEPREDAAVSSEE